MPIKIQNGLPARAILESENVFIMDEDRAESQDIRPLEILILNLMPLKEDTETQLLRALSNTPLQVECTYMTMSTHESTHTSASHLNKFYVTFPEIKKKHFDGMIITGAPVEKIDFEQVDYWPELCEIMDFSETNVYSTLHVCWGAQAGLYYHYGIRKELLLPLLCGVFLVESFSVMMQVGYFKYTKRKYGEGHRLLLMAPVHHHFQKKGQFETKIVLRFWIISLLLAAWFTDLRLKLKGQTFFKTVIYMPNLIMASAFAMLFFALFSDNGPVNAALVGMGILKEPFSFLNSVWGNRGLIGLMNFLMWFGNTTIMLMAAIMGVDPTLYEAAELDGCTPNQMFWKITLPLIRPILVYVMITSMIGGLQMFDVPQILTNGKGGPDRTSTTMIMYLNNHLFSKNYGMAGAVSVVLFLVCAVLCVVVYFSLTKEDDGLTKAQRKELKAAKKAAAKGGK